MTREASLQTCLLLAARAELLVMHLNGTPGVCQSRGTVEIVVVHGNKSQAVSGQPGTCIPENSNPAWGITIPAVEFSRCGSAALPWESFSYHFLVCFSIRRRSSNNLHSYHLPRRPRQLTDAQDGCYFEILRPTRFCYNQHLLRSGRPFLAHPAGNGDTDGTNTWP
jgi:hypothetical protein